MKIAPLPMDEKKRLEVLWDYQVLDTPPEECFDDVTSLAAHICEAPIALITLVDEDRQWFMSRFGLSESETSRNISFCSHAILQPGLMIVPDAIKDARFADNPLVKADPKIRFYAGAPLITPEGAELGTLCVFDRRPRAVTHDQKKALRVLSRHTMSLLELRRRSRELVRVNGDRQYIADELMASEERMKDLLENANDLVQSVDVSGKFIYVNRAWRQALGYEEEDIPMLSLMDIIHPDSRVHCEEMFRKVLAGEKLERVEAVFVARDGSPIDVEGSANCKFANGQALYTRGIFRNVSDRKQTESKLRECLGSLEKRVQERTRELQQTNQQLHQEIARRKAAEQTIRQLNESLEQKVLERTMRLKEVNRDLEAFSYSISHDLRTPLNSISSFASIIEEDHGDQLNHEGRSCLERIRNTAQRLIRLSEDLLNYSRLGRKAVRFELVDMKRLLQDIATEYKPQMTALNAEFALPEDLPVVQADQSLLEQIFENLLSNAIRYRKPDISLRVEVQCREENGSVVVQVSDNGIGIAPDYHEKIFKIFERLHDRREYPGSGVGRAIVKRAVDMLGGEVWVESSGKEGSTFCVRLPKTPPNHLRRANGRAEEDLSGLSDN